MFQAIIYEAVEVIEGVLVISIHWKDCNLRKRARQEVYKKGIMNKNIVLGLSQITLGVAWGVSTFLWSSSKQNLLYFYLFVFFLFSLGINTIYVGWLRSRGEEIFLMMTPKTYSFKFIGIMTIISGITMIFSSLIIFLVTNELLTT